MRLDKENGNTHWQDAMDLELTQIHEYKVFKDTGKAKFHNGKVCHTFDRISSTTPGAEPPRGAKDSGSARSHSTHLETSSQKRP